MIYDHPRDYPNHWVVRRQWAGRGRVHCDLRSYPFETLEGARKFVSDGNRIRWPAQPGDDPCIVECWF